MLVVAAATAAGCSSSTAPASPTPASTQVSVQLSINPLGTDAVVVGADVQLVPVLTLDGVPQSTPVDAVVWSSSNDAVAKVSASGIVSGVGPGAAVVTAVVKTQSATLSVDVVPNVAGELTVTWLAADCSQPLAECFGGTPRLHSGRIIVTQSGTSVEGTWDPIRDWPDGSPPFSGRILTDGSMDLSGSSCPGPDDNNNYTLYSVTNWHMTMTSAGGFSGGMTSAQEGSFWTAACSGSPHGSRVWADFTVKLVR